MHAPLNRSALIAQAAADPAEFETCFLCGRSGLRDGRFCSSRCRTAYDAGSPRHDPHHARALAAVPLDSWKVIAGPPGSVVGASYYAPLLEQMRGRQKARKVAAGPRSLKPKSVKNNRVQPMACKGTLS